VNASSTLDRTFPAHPSSLAEIRTWLRDRAVEAGASSEDVEELALAANEAATNALLHSGSRTIEVRWRAGDDSLEVEIVDGGTFKRQIRIVQLHRPGGYGIPLMMSLVDEVLIREGSDLQPGTTVRLTRRRRT
jgi:anti-sigma regulatory factor (Ser/Thr protein kinase)